MNLAGHATKVTMIVRGKELTASLSRYLVDRILSHPTMEVRYESEVTKPEGDGVLQKVEITNHRDGTTESFDTNKLFVCIGGKPNTEWAKDTQIVRDGAGYLVTAPILSTKGAPRTSGRYSAFRTISKPAFQGPSQRATCAIVR